MSNFATQQSKHTMTHGFSSALICQIKQCQRLLSAT